MNHIVSKLFVFIVTACLLLLLTNCSKELLNRKPNTGIVIPETLSDMKQLLDHVNVMYSSPAIGIMSGEEYYYSAIDSYNSLRTKTEKNCYTWNTDLYGGELNIPDWNAPYASVFTANVVLEQWQKLTEADKESMEGKYVKAWALFCRSYAFYNLVQIFSPAYDQATAGTDLGIPLKLSANINNIEPRATEQATYDRVLTDLEASIPLFPNSFPAKNLNRASKASAYALLARIYISMREYDKAGIAADSSLSYYNSLVDYNTLDSTVLAPFTADNKELLFYSLTNLLYYASEVGLGPCAVDRDLIYQYDAGDLRKKIYFQVKNGVYFTKTLYTGNGGYYPFTGLAVDEVYLIKAECQARNNDIPGAEKTINDLLIKRYQTGTYTSFVATSKEAMLNKVLLERRKELVWRGLRWSDLKRLNLEGANITLTRTLDGKTYTLPPNDPRYVMPIPADEIALSHIQQNQR